MNKLINKAELVTTMFRKSDPKKPLTKHEQNVALLNLEQHVNSFPLLNFDDVTILVRLHLKGEPNEELDPDTCTLDNRHPNLRCG